MMKRDRLDRFFERVGNAIALVRVLRGEDPSDVRRQVAQYTAQAERLRAQIDNVGRQKREGDDAA